MTIQHREIFVFGSNLGGIHGAGSARHAALYYGAIRGVGVGPQGDAYAIPTKNARLRVLPLEVIATHVSTFLTYARQHPMLTFKVVAIGCGLAGYRAAQIAPLFVEATPNVQLPPEFEPVMETFND